MSKLREGDIAIFNTDSGGNIQAVDDSAKITRETQIDRGDCESNTSPMITGETTPTLTNATWVRQGKAAVFDGITGKVVIPGGTPNIGTGDFSIVFWMKSKDITPKFFGTLFSKWIPAPSGIMIRSDGATNALEFFMRKNPIQVTGTFNAAPFDTNWNHIAIIVNRTTDIALCYLNSIKDAVEIDLSTLPADSSNTGNVTFGARSDASSFYEGDIKDMAIYDGLALNQSQIDDLFDGTPLDISTANLVAWYAFDNDVLDNSGNGEHGTPTAITYVEGPASSRISFEDDFSYKFTKTNISGNIARVSLTDNESISDMHGLIAGFTYRFSAYEFAASIGIDFADVQIGIAEFYDSTWHFNLIDADIADAWDNSKVTVEINESTTGAYIFFQAKSTTDQFEYFYIDEISLFRLDDKFSRSIEPIMDGGFESAAEITLEGGDGTNFWMNEYLTEDEKIISAFIGFIQGNPLTLLNINRAQELALSDFQWFINVGIADTIDIVVEAVSKNRVDVTVIILANGEELFKNIYEVNWGFQENDSATGRII